MINDLFSNSSTHRLNYTTERTKSTLVRRQQNCSFESNREISPLHKRLLDPNMEIFGDCVTLLWHSHSEIEEKRRSEKSRDGIFIFF